MPNPSNALGTPNEYSGLTSREGYAASANNAFSRGVVSGFAVVQNTTLNMTVLMGGASGTKDVALALSPNGDMYTIYNKSNAQISVTIPTAPSTNSRIDSIVLYRDLAATSSSATTDNPAVVGYQVVSGATATTPVAPTDTQIRAALTNGSSAAFCVVATVVVAAGTTTITNSLISAAERARITLGKINGGSTAGIVKTDASGNVTAAAEQSWIAPILTNSWVNFGAPYNSTGYMKDSMGFVHLKGMVRLGTSTQPIFTLPAGYRPSMTVYTAAPNGGAVAEIGILLIGADGTVKNGTGTNSYQSLDCISFRAEA